MSDALHAEGEQAPPSPEEDEARHHCEQLYARWLHARAAHYDPDEDLGDDAMAERDRRELEAARRLLAVPSVLPWMIWRKLEVLELWAEEERLGGHAVDNRLIFALGCFKADLLRFGIGGEAE
jgi:hypothetical protein